MKPHFTHVCVVVAGIVAAAGFGPAMASAQNVPAKDDLTRIEAMPDKFRNRLADRNAQLVEGASSSRRLHPSYVIRLSKRWPPGTTVRVAFLGGSDALHRKIADAAGTWTRFGNVSFDFIDATTGSFRTWSLNDTSYGAEVRISFDRGGYYSLVGSDSMDPSLSAAGEESMNLARFDRALPTDWRAIVLHEFGHALGFEHEHQHPETPCDFRWEDAPGYIPTQDSDGVFIRDRQGHQPGLYTVLGGPPNNWPKPKVDFNLRRSLQDLHLT